MADLVRITSCKVKTLMIYGENILFTGFWLENFLSFKLILVRQL